MSETTNLKLFKHNEPLETNENQFDVDLALNQNWDKIDEFAGDVNDKVKEIEDNIDGQALDIEQLQQEQQTQNKDIENLQTNDTKQNELISKLKNAALNAETEESKSIHVTDASTIGQLEVLGNQEQETRSGKNRFKLPDSGNNNGIIYTNNGDGTFNISGTAQEQASFSIVVPLENSGFEQGKSYTVSSNIEIGNIKYYVHSCTASGAWNKTLLDFVNETSKTKEMPEPSTDYISLNIVVFKDVTVNYQNVTVQIEEGTVATEYEQYGASPSSEYSSPVVCLGSNKNELDIEEIETNSYASVVDNQNGILELEGINGFYSGVYIEKQLKPNTDYTICAKLTEVSDKGRGRIEVNSNSNFLEHSFANLDFNKELVKKSISFKTDATGLVYIIFYCNWTGNNENVKYENIKLEEGTEATPYSPPGQGSTLISKINKNIYDITKYPFTNRIAYNSSGEQVFWTGYCGILDYFPVKGNTQYTFSNNLNKPIYCGLVFYNKDKQVISAISTNTTTFTTPENCKYIRFAIQSDTLPTWVQIELGNTATSNIEHKQTDYLLYIQQEMLKGNYFIKEADGWKEVHSYSKKIFNGTEAWNLESLSQGNNFYTNIPDALGDTTAPVYSNCFMYYNGLLDKNYSCRISGSKNLNLRCNEKNTAEEFKQMLADKYNTGNPVYAFYKTATPTKLACTPEQSAVLEELNNLDLFEGVNNIITAEDIALLKLKYALDVKTYVDNQLANVNAQILNIAGGN